MILFTWGFWVKQNKYKNELDEESITDGDFAVMFQNLPIDISKSSLHQLIIDADVDPGNIVYTNKWYRINNIIKYQKQREFWMHKLKYLEMFRQRYAQDNTQQQLEELYPKRNLLSRPPFARFPTEKEIKDNLEEVEKELNKDNNQKVIYSGTTIIVMKNQRDADKLIKFYEIGFWKSLLSTKHMIVSRWPEPDDIIWENMSFSILKRRIVTSFIFFFWLVLLIPVYFFINFVRTQNERISNSEDEEGSLLDHMILSIILLGVNVSMEIYIIVSTNFEHQITNTMKELSIVYKLSLLEFLNICLIPLLGKTASSKWFESDGLVQEVTVIIILMNVSEIVRMIFNPQYILHQFLKAVVWCRRSNLEISQKQANWIYETDQAHIAKTLSTILIFWFSILFYSPLIPGLIVFGVIGSIVMYITLRTIILRRMAIKKSISAKLLESPVDLLKIAILFNSIMAFIFFTVLFGSPYMVTYVTVIVDVIFWVLPARKYLLKWTDKEVQRDELKNNFHYEKSLRHYDILNPVTKNNGISRLEGNSLKDAIRRWILYKLKVKYFPNVFNYLLNSIRFHLDVESNS